MKIKRATIKIEHSQFIYLLKKSSITQKMFSEYAQIPYDTVTGWKKKGYVPAYAMVIAKDMVYRKKSTNSIYLTAIQALNYHHYDWHKGSVNYDRRYPGELKEWSSWVIGDNIANPIRAYLDYLYYNIKFQKRVPNMKIDMFLFDDSEAKEIEEKIETMLKPTLTAKEELEILSLYRKYLKGGKYDFRSKTYTQRKALRERYKAS